MRNRGNALRGTARGLALAAGVWAAGCGPAAEPPPEAAPAASAAANRAPVIHSLRIEPTDAVPGQPVRAVVDASDPDGDKLDIGLRWQLDGERYGSGEATIAIPESSPRARVEVEAVASDGRGGNAREHAALELRNRPPRLTQVALHPSDEVRAGETVTAVPEGDDPDGDTVAFEHTWFVNGEPVNEPSLVLGDRHFDRGDTIEFEVSAVDADDESEPWRSPPIRVLNSPPVIVSSPTGLREDGTFHYRIEPRDPDGDRVFRYRLIEGPKGMQLDWLSGVVSWQPTDDQAGAHAVKLEADDQRGGVAAQSFQITVEIAPKTATPPAKAKPAE
jgi:hypothetical protein